VVLQRRRVSPPDSRFDPERKMTYNKSVKKNVLALVVLLLFSALAGAAVEQQKKRTAKDLPPQYRKWLQEEVVYIITPKERDVFLQLESDRERNIFIDAFWKQRDPDPTTEENEFKTEHYRRIQYANLWFGRDVPGAGWRTDMGRIYIILGEPKSTEKYENEISIRPVILWFYEGMSEYGLPGTFTLLFYKRDVNTEYRLYSPVSDGPYNLKLHYACDPGDIEAAYRTLNDLIPSVADASISLIPGETQTNLAPSLASEILLRQRIPAAPMEKVKDDYAEKLLRYKDIIEVDYSANYIQNDALIGVFQDAQGQSFVHYAIEPSRLTFEERDGRYRADVLVNAKISDEKNRTIYQFDRSFPLRLDQDQFTRIRPLPVSFQDLFPLVPGRYKVNILWKNSVAKEFTSLEADLLIPARDAFAMSQPILSYRTDRESKYRGTNKSFLIGGVQYQPNPRSIFLPGDTLSVFFQVQNPPEALRRNGRIEYTIFKNAMPVVTRTRTFQDAVNGTDFSEEFPLAGYGIANYLLQISIQDADGTERVGAKTPFGITSIPNFPRPWAVSVPLPSANDPAIGHALGEQYFRTGDVAKARPLLEAAHRGNPQSAAFALDYARLLFSLKEYAEVRSIARTFMTTESRYEFLQLLGDASKGLGEYGEAVTFYKDYLAHFGTNIVILNAIGECYVQVGNIPEALVAYERSLELDPKQENIRALVKTLKEKK
jgi:GWxTD domain-containing protein